MECEIDFVSTVNKIEYFCLTIRRNSIDYLFRINTVRFLNLLIITLYLDMGRAEVGIFLGEMVFCVFFGKGISTFLASFSAAAAAAAATAAARLAASSLACFSFSSRSCFSTCSRSFFSCSAFCSRAFLKIECLN